MRGLGRSSCTTLLADKGYDSDALRLALLEENIFPCLAVSNKRIESRPFHRGYYRKRHRVENFFQSLKRWRRVATRYDKLASSFFRLCYARLYPSLVTIQLFFKHTLSNAWRLIMFSIGLGLARWSGVMGE